MSSPAGLRPLPQPEAWQPITAPAHTIYDALLSFDALITGFPLADARDLQDLKAEQYGGLLDIVMDTAESAAYRDRVRLGVLLAAMRIVTERAECVRWRDDGLAADYSRSECARQMSSDFRAGVNWIAERYREYVQFCDYVDLMDPHSDDRRALARSRWQCWNSAFGRQFRMRVEHFRLMRIDTGFDREAGPVLVDDRPRTPHEQSFREIDPDRRCRQMCAAMDIFLHPAEYVPTLGMDLLPAEEREWRKRNGPTR